MYLLWLKDKLPLADFGKVSLDDVMLAMDALEAYEDAERRYWKAREQ